MNALIVVAAHVVAGLLAARWELGRVLIIIVLINLSTSLYSDRRYERKKTGETKQ